MISGKYEKDIERASKITKVLEKRVKDLFQTKSRAAIVFGGLTGLSLYSSRTYVIRYTVYGPYQISDAIKREINPSQLERLAVFYQMLNIDINDEIINLTKEINSNFQYPPENFPERTEVKCNVNVRFSRKGYELTEDQKKHLEELALYYAQGNKSKLSKSG